MLSALPMSISILTSLFNRTQIVGTDILTLLRLQQQIETEEQQIIQAELQFYKMSLIVTSTPCSFAC